MIDAKGPNVTEPNVVLSHNECFKTTDKIVGAPFDSFPGAHPPAFQDQQAQQKWDEARRAAAMRQTVPIAVSPGCNFVLSSGRAVFGGDEIYHLELPSAQLALLEQRGVIIRLSADEVRLAACADNWRFRVAPHEAIITRAGIKTEGAEIVEADFEFGLARIKELIAKGIVVERKPAPAETAAQ